MVKGLKGTRQNLNCSRVIKLTMGLRLYFLKPLKCCKFPLSLMEVGSIFSWKKATSSATSFWGSAKLPTTGAIWKKGKGRDHLFLPFFPAEFIVLKHSWKALPRRTTFRTDFYTKGLEEGNMSKRENSKEHTGEWQPTEMVGFEFCRSTEILIRLNISYWMNERVDASSKLH